MAGNLRKLQKFVLSITIAITIFAWVGAAPAQAARLHPGLTPRSQGLSCIRPVSHEEKSHCSEIENRILSVTVMIELQAQFYLQGYRIVKETHSHATILAGRYLVTHNHYQFPINKTAADGEEGYLAISLRKANGELILDHAPLSVFKIAQEEAQTLILEFSNQRGEGLFASLGLPSAQAAAWLDTRLELGDELAQIDWNGRTPHVDWVQVERLDLTLDVPQIQVGNFNRHGSSGGGVFWNGLHIGNNWARNIEMNAQTGQIARRYSIIALNPATTLR